MQLFMQKLYALQAVIGRLAEKTLFIRACKSVHIKR
jgi:hypothetical protein